MDWLISLFKLILYSSLLGSILAVVIIMVKLILRKRLGVRWQYFIWLLLLVRLIIPYAPQSQFSVFNLFSLLENKISQVSSISNYYTGKSTISFSENQINGGNKQRSKNTFNNVTMSKDNSQSKSNNFTINRMSWIQVVCILWLMGVISYTIYSAFVIITFMIKLKSQKICKDERIINVLEQCIHRMNIKKSITIISTDMVRGPATFGFIKPKLLLPINIDKRLNLNELRYIILHEMAHLKRRDIQVSCLKNILQILHWFNPIIRYSFYRMGEDKELACDALALTYINEDECLNYGRTIIKLLQSFKKPVSIYGIANFIDNKSQIKRRITMISLFKKNSYKWTALSVATILLVGTVMLTNAKSTTVLADSGKKPNVKISQHNSKKLLMDILLEAKISRDICLLYMILKR